MAKQDLKRTPQRTDEPYVFLSHRRYRAQVDGLRGVSCDLGIDVQGTRTGTLVVTDGAADFIPDEPWPCDASVRFDNPEDVGALLRGELHPVVAVLQRRMDLDGDRPLGARVILGLRTGAEFVPVASGTER